jgi:hypothetical protein
MSNITAASVATMQKAQLRAACRDAGIQYGKLSVTAMREALVAQLPTLQGAQEEAPVVPEVAHDTLLVDTVLAPVVPEVPQVAPAATVPATPVPPRASSKGIKIQKDRRTQNGVKEPSEGSVCRAVWDYLQNEVDKDRVVTVKSVKAHAPTVGWNPNNASIEYYNWRKFHGIKGRSAPTLPGAPAPTEPAAS